MRLTKKFKTDYYFNTDHRDIVKKDIENDFYAAQAIRNKLGQLEDIEDELGVSLITLFKAMKNGIYYTNYGQGTINYCDKPRLIPCYLCESSNSGEMKRKLYGYDFIVSNKGLTISLRTYKKFWALTKEELENDIK